MIFSYIWYFSYLWNLHSSFSPFTLLKQCTIYKTLQRWMVLNSPLKFAFALLSLTLHYLFDIFPHTICGSWCLLIKHRQLLSANLASFWNLLWLGSLMVSHWVDISFGQIPLPKKITDGVLGMGWPLHFVFTWVPCFLRTCVALGLTGSEMSGLLETLKPETPPPSRRVTPGTPSLLLVETITSTKHMYGHRSATLSPVSSVSFSCALQLPCPGLAWHRASIATGEDKRWLIAKPKNHPSHSSYPKCSSF